METPEKNIDTTQESVVQPTPSAEETALHACQTEVSQWKEKFVQLNADFVNYKRRVEKDQLQWAHMAQVRVLTKMLSIVDNLERAYAEKPVITDEKLQAWVNGITMIQADVAKTLHAFEVKEIACSGQFDPEKHEALIHTQSDTHTSGDIISVLEKGYQMGDTILRPAKVSVAQ